MCLRAEIRVATSSMTSVPKPLKMLREYYQQLKDSYESMASIIILEVAHTCILLFLGYCKNKEQKITGRHHICYSNDSR